MTQQCSACSDCDGGEEVRGHRHRRSVYVKQAGFHVMGPRRGSLRASLVSVDLQVRVLWSSDLVDRPSDYLYVCTIPLSGFMDRQSRYRGV